MFYLYYNYKTSGGERSSNGFCKPEVVVLCFQVFFLLFLLKVLVKFFLKSNCV